MTKRTATKVVLVSLVALLMGAQPIAGQPSSAQQLSITDLGPLVEHHSIAYGINDRGQVVGTGFTASGENHAVLWEDGKATDLLEALPGETFGAAHGINNRGQVVGYIETASAFLWEDGEMTDLGTLPGGKESSAFDISNRGQVGWPWRCGCG